MLKKNLRLLFFVLGAAILFGWAIFLRGYDLDTQSWWIDEGYSINAAVATIDNGYPLLDTGWLYKGQLAFTYPLAATIKTLGLENWTTRLPALGFNLVFLVVFYLFVRKFWDRETAIVATAIAAFSYWEIAWSRQARHYTMLQLSLWISLYYYFSLLFKQGQWRDWLGLILSTGLTFLTHGLGLLLLPIYLVGLLLKIILLGTKDLLKKLKQLPGLRTIVVTIGLLVLCLFVFIQLKDLPTGTVLGLTFRRNYLDFILDNYFFTAVYALGGIILSLYLGNKLERVKTMITSLIYLLPLLAVSVFVLMPGHRYLFPFLPVLYLFVALAIVTLYRLLVKKLQFGPAIFICILLISPLFFNGELHLNPTTTYELESDLTKAEQTELGREPYDFYIYTPQSDWEAAYEAIKADYNPESDKIISVQPVFTKLYLDTEGYWLPFRLNLYAERPNQNPYVNAESIITLEELVEFTEQYDGYILFDYLSLDSRINLKTFKYIKNNLEFEQIYSGGLNPWSELAVYRF